MSSELKDTRILHTLSEDLRDKALEYAAMLGARGPRPTTALGTAVNLAREWQSGNLPASSERGEGVALLVQPRKGRWIIRHANSAEPSHVFSMRDDAVRRAQELIQIEGAPLFVFGPGGTLLERYPAPGRRPLPELRSRAIARPLPRPSLVPPEPLSPVGPEAVEPAAVTSPATSSSEVIAEVTPEVPVTLRKVGRKWVLSAPDGTTETFTTRRKGDKIGQELALRLGTSYRRL